jgi:AmmeMemoRadiSam system protein A
MNRPLLRARIRPINIHEQGTILLSLARAAIAREFGIEHPAETERSWLHEPSACFVTLIQYEELRGCIGSLEPHRTLLSDVQANARAAAFSDPRFAPLTQVEFDATEVEISLLSPLQPLRFSDERAALMQLQPGVDGIVFEFGRYRSTFLPQVWEQLATPREFIARLKVKAGLPADFWSDGVKLYRYSVTKWQERDFDFA